MVPLPFHKQSQSIQTFSLSIFHFLSKKSAMAATWKSHRYLGGTERMDTATIVDDPFEFDEAEVWSTNSVSHLSETKETGSNPRPFRKLVKKSVHGDRLPVGPRSLPMNVPDWPKILRSEYTKRTGELEDDYDDEEEEDDENERIPPHEYLARTRVASLSVHEGVGRTLKGRDLSRIRNAIWKQTGFED